MEYFGEDGFRGQQGQMKLEKRILAKAMPRVGLIEHGDNRAGIDECVSGHSDARDDGGLPYEWIVRRLYEGRKERQ